MQRFCMTGQAVFALLLALSTAMAWSGLDQARLAAAGFLPRGTEITGLRTANARHFSNGDGSIRAIIAASGQEPTDNVVIKQPAGYSGYIKSPYFGNPPGRYLGDMKCGKSPIRNNEEERAFAEWDVTSIPDGSTVQSIRCSTYCYPSTQVPEPPTSVVIRDISNRPYTVPNDFSGNQSLFNDIGSGCVYGTYESPNPPGWLVAELSAQARQDLENRLTANWFAVGYDHYYEGSAQEWEICFKGWNDGEGRKPQLVVDYIPAGAPGKPIPESPPSPPNGGTATVFRPTLQVAAISGAYKYNFRLREQGRTTWEFDVEVTSRSWSPTSDLTHGRAYEWDCRAGNAIDWGPYSDRWTFTVQIPLPAAPQLLTPPDGATLSTLLPTMTVGAVQYADSYNFRVLDGVTLVEEETTHLTNWTMTVPLTNGKTYTWTCKAHNVAGWGPAAAARSFTPRLPPVPLSPIGGAQVDTVQPLLQVNAYPGATNFDFRVYNSAGTQVAQGYSTTPVWQVTSLLANEQWHRWKCRAEIAGGWSDTCASSWFFVHDLPHAPVQETPANGSTVNTFSPKFRVTPQYDAKKYEFVIYNNPGNTIVASGQSDSCAWYPSPYVLDNNTWYDWDCRVQNSAGWGPYCSRWTFRVVAQPPPAPTPLEPPDNSSVSTYLPTMRVAWIPDATKYRFRIFQGGSQVGPTIETSNNYAQPSSPLSNATTYDWDCAAENRAGQGNYFADQWTFTVRVLPAAPVLTGPNNGDTIQNPRPTFSWNAAAEAQTYQIQIANNSAFSPTLYDVPGLDVLSWPPPADLSELKPWYWRVRGNNVAGSGPWSTRRISIDRTPPEVPMRDGPEQDTSRNNAPLLDWAKLGEENRRYRLDVKKDGISLAGFPREIAQPYGADNSFYQFPSNALTDGQYFWTVEARDSAGNWSLPQTPAFWFWVDRTPPAVPELVSPAPGEEVHVSLPLLDWNPVEDARRFVVELYDATHSLCPGFPRVVTQNVNEDHSHYQLCSGQSLNNGSYTWRVRSFDYAGNASDFSDETGFRVKLATGGRPGWVEVSPMPEEPTLAKPPKDGAWMVTHCTGIDVLPVLYAAKGNKTTDFYMYNPMEGDSGTWHEKRPIPENEGAKVKPPSKGCVGVSDGARYIYMTKGNSTLGFWRYDVSTNTWDSMPGVPEGPYGKRVKGGTDMVFATYRDTGCVYLLKGYKTEFYRYNPLARRWDTLPEVPYGGNAKKYDKGSFLVYDGVNTIYAHQSKYYDKTQENPHHFMFRYDVAADSWCRAPLSGMPVQGFEGGRDKNKKSADGAAGAWFGDNLYALKGGNTQGFFKYWPDGDTWSQLDTVPGNGSTGSKKRVKAGGDLVSYLGGIFFALKGNKCYELWRYVEPALEASSFTPQARSGVQTGKSAVGSLRLAISPNPIATGFATLRYSLLKPGPFVVTVFDAAGRAIRQQRFAGNRVGAVTLDLRRLAGGVYLVRLDAEGLTQTQKLVVQR